jgi:N-acetylmuramoyl-L-alanine amidase
VSSRRRSLLGRFAVAFGITVALWAGLRREKLRAALHVLADLAVAPSMPGAHAWPSPSARLTAPKITYPPDFGVHRLYVDAGHGAPGNPGNTSCFCEKEQDYTLFAARELARRLSETGHFDVRLSRGDDGPVDYHDRVDDAVRFGADAFLSLHSDVRKRPERWSPEPGLTCPVSYAAPGFSVLYSDEGDEAEVGRRRLLARETGFRLAAIGLLPYDGADYAHLYEADAQNAGVFIDRHAPDQRIFVLYRPPIPAIIIETHHALDPREATRFREPATLDAFAAAITAALVDSLSPAAARLTSSAGAPRLMLRQSR